MSTSDLPEELASRLGEAADAIDHGDTTVVLAQVRGTAARRRRRRQAAVGVAAVGALAASGLVIANVVGDDGDQLIVSAPATDPAESAGDEDVVTSGVEAASTGDGVAPDEVPDLETLDEATTGVPDVAAPAVTQPVPGSDQFPVRGASVEYLGEPLSGEELMNGFPSQLLAWNGGFLAITTVSEAQALPTELPPEIAEQFPQEVLDLFPDGLPPTIDEATQMLQDAGLFDVVSEIVLENPDVFDAVYSQPVDVVSTARFSIDGETWDEIDSAIPSGVLQGRFPVAAGDRLVSASLEDDEVVVRSSTDLVTWDEQVIAVPTRPPGLSDLIEYEVSTGQIVANADRWVIDISTHGHFDVSRGLDGPIGEQARNGQADYEFVDEGVRFTVRRDEDYQELPEDEVETTVVPWSDWGLEEAPDTDSLFSSRRFTAAWDQPVQESVAAVDRRFSGQLLALDQGFVDLTPPLRFTTDGIDWVELDGPFDGHVSWALPAEGGFVALGFDNIGRSAAFVHDLADASWTEVDLLDVPVGSQTGAQSGGALLLSDYGDPFDDLVAVSVTTAEVDGYRFEQRSTRGDDVSASYTVIDVDTGEVVSSETISADDAFGAEFEFVETNRDVDDYSQAGFRVLDPATGDVLVFVPFQEATWTNLDAAGEEIGNDELSGAYEGPMDVEHWVVATDSGGMVVQRLEPDTSGARFPVGVARNDELVLVGFGDGTFARTPI